jgi:hypothetical protein
MATWVDESYHRLRKEPLSLALNEAILPSGAKMVVYAQQPETVDLR